MSVLTAFRFLDLLNATSGGGAFQWSIHSDGTVNRCCLACGAEFPQTEDGHEALRVHEFEHGAATTCTFSELQGKSLRIVVVKNPSHYGGDDTEVWGVDDAAGVVYHLSNAYTRKDCWKWKLTKQTKPSDGPMRMLIALASPSNGSENTVAK